MATREPLLKLKVRKSIPWFLDGYWGTEDGIVGLAFSAHLGG